MAGLTVFSAGPTVLGVDLGVARSHRRRGLARRLIAHAVAVSGEVGATHAVAAPTPATVSLYERLGFELERSWPDVLFYLP